MDAITVTLESTQITATLTTPETIAVSLTSEPIAVTVQPSGAQGPQGIQGIQGESYTRSFTTIEKNLDAFDIVSTSASETQVVKTYDSGNGTTITVTLNLDENGNPTTKVISGDGVPAGIDTICIYDFSGGEDAPPIKTYTTGD